MARGEVLRWCRAQGLFAPGDTVTAALSGGADSTAMLHLLLSLRDALGIEVRAAHFHHHLRGAEADRDQAFCRELCRRWGVPLRCGGADAAAYAREQRVGLETAARTLRYQFFDTLDGKVATAHTADDHLETVLLHLTRGAALRGLGGIPPVRGKIVRPVLCLTRTEIEAYLAENGLEYVTDSTNGTDFCPRNRLRRQVIPALRAENPAAARAALAAAEALRADEALLQAQADEWLSRCRIPGGLDAAALAQAPRPLRLRALRRVLEAVAPGRLTAAHLAAADALLFAGPSASADLPGLRLRRAYAKLLWTAAEDLGFAPFFLAPSASHPLPGGRRIVSEGPFPYDGRPGLCLALPGPLRVRPRRAGDRLRREAGEKTLKALMIDKKVPAAQRGGVPVLECGGQIAAVWGIGADPRFRPEMGQPCCRIDIRE